MPKTPHACKAVQYSDQMVCHACGLYWDVNDPDPPACQRGKRKAAPITVEVKPPRLHFPEVLPPDVAAEMVKTYQANGGRAEGMRAAYRLLLDRISPD